MNMKQRLADDPLHYAKNDLVSIFKVSALKSTLLGIPGQ